MIKELNNTLNTVLSLLSFEKHDKQHFNPQTPFHSTSYPNIAARKNFFMTENLAKLSNRYEP